MTVIVWFRRDLRLHDHPPLHEALAADEHVLPVFVFDDAILKGRFESGTRAWFALESLKELDAGLRDRGSGLVVRHGKPETELCKLAAETGAEAVYWASDVSPYARGRDARVTEALEDHGVEARPQPGNFAADINRIRTKEGKPFAVFSPFHRAWEDSERRIVHRAPAELPPLPSKLAKGRLPSLGSLGLECEVPEPIEPGEAAGRRALQAWLDGGVEHYASQQDRFAQGSSQLSPYLHFGCVSAREADERAGARSGEGPLAWRRQLAWRDFYAHVLLLNPGNAKQEYQPRFRKLQWDTDDGLLDAWKEGRTGYPLVDAGMRQLAATGWMHNRARLVVGSFLTKDLHLDWREGEAHFMRYLLDGDEASNNGNWQWIASVGVDPAPYFRRMFNPTLQMEKFDPQGEYVRRWVPELAGVPDEHLREPWEMDATAQRAAGCEIGADYPAPVVDHAEERRRAIERYRAATG
jgi:deoxyribodipyrimidine photo-lyase